MLNLQSRTNYIPALVMGVAMCFVFFIGISSAKAAEDVDTTADPDTSLQATLDALKLKVKALREQVKTQRGVNADLRTELTDTRDKIREQNKEERKAKRKLDRKTFRDSLVGLTDAEKKAAMTQYVIDLKAAVDQRKLDRDAKKAKRKLDRKDDRAAFKASLKDLSPEARKAAILERLEELRIQVLDRQAKLKDRIDTANDKLDEAGDDSDSGTASSEGIVLGISSITETKTSAAFSGDSDTGKFVFTIEVTAFGENFYMDENIANVDFDLLVDGVVTSASSVANVNIAGANPATTADYKLEEGNVSTLTLTVDTTAGVSGAVNVRVNSISYSAVDDATAELIETASPTSDWTSGSLILN